MDKEDSDQATVWTPTLFTPICMKPQLQYKYKGCQAVTLMLKAFEAALMFILQNSISTLKQKFEVVRTFETALPSIKKYISMVQNPLPEQHKSCPRC